jgi:hypothetical protein
MKRSSSLTLCTPNFPVHGSRCRRSCSCDLKENVRGGLHFADELSL